MENEFSWMMTNFWENATDVNPYSSWFLVLTYAVKAVGLLWIIL